MDGWIDGQKDRTTKGRIEGAEGWSDGRIDGQRDRTAKGRIEGQRDGRMDG